MMVLALMSFIRTTMLDVIDSALLGLVAALFVALFVVLTLALRGLP